MAFGRALWLDGRRDMGYYPALRHTRKHVTRCTMPLYKVVEVNTVTEDILEGVLNEWTAKGWRFDGMQFAMRDASRRPAMAFVFFTRDEREVAP